MLLWPAGSMLGAGAGSALGWWIIDRFINYVPEAGAVDLLGILILMPMTGLGLGFGQFLSVRRYLSGAGWWVVATALGWLLGLSVDFSLQRIWGPTSWLGFGLAGLYQGALQWLLLRRRGRVSIAWLAASTLGWLAAGWVFASINQPLNRLFETPRGGLSASVAAWAAGGLVFAVITAPVIIRLLRRRQ